MAPFDIVVIENDGRPNVRSRQVTAVAALTHVLRLKPVGEVKALDTVTGEYLSLADLRLRARREPALTKAPVEDANDPRDALRDFF